MLTCVWYVCVLICCVCGRHCCCDVLSLCVCNLVVYSVRSVLHHVFTCVISLLLVLLLLYLHAHACYNTSWVRVWRVCVVTVLNNVCVICIQRCESCMCAITQLMWCHMCVINVWVMIVLCCIMCDYVLSLVFMFSHIVLCVLIHVYVPICVCFICVCVCPCDCHLSMRWPFCITMLI